MAGLKRERSGYKLTEKHVSLGGDKYITERDYSTIIPNLNSTSDNAVIFNSGNFVIQTNLTNDNEKQVEEYKEGQWVGNENEMVEDISIAHKFTYKDLVINERIEEEDKDTKNTEYYYKPHINCEDVRRYISYGSLYDVVQNSIAKIVNLFPGSLYVPNRRELSGFNFVNFEIQNMVLVIPLINITNDFNIILEKKYIDNTITDEYSLLKIFNKSHKDYLVRFTDRAGKLSKYTYGIKAYSIDKNNGFLRLLIDDYLPIDYKTQFNGLHILPNRKYQEMFRNKLSILEKHILNENTMPLYRFNLNLFTENGQTKKSYQWPIYDGYNIEFKSGNFKNFQKTFLSDISVSDNLQSNKLYNIYTHSGVKTHDNTKYEDYDGKLKDIIGIYGYMFDDLKQDIYNLSNVNTLHHSYKKWSRDNNLNNQMIKNKGWDNSGLRLNTNKEIPIVFQDKYQYNLSNKDVEEYFDRNFLIDNQWFGKKKGTKETIHDLCSMMGFKIEIDEYNVTHSEIFNVSTLNEIKNLNAILIKSGEVYGKEITPDYAIHTPLYGLPIIEINGLGFPKPLPDNDEMYFEKDGYWNGVSLQKPSSNQPHIHKKDKSGETVVKTIDNFIEKTEYYDQYRNIFNFLSPEKYGSYTYMTDDGKIETVHFFNKDTTTGKYNAPRYFFKLKLVKNINDKIHIEEENEVIDSEYRMKLNTKLIGLSYFYIEEREVEYFNNVLYRKIEQLIPSTTSLIVECLKDTVMDIDCKISGSTETHTTYAKTINDLKSFMSENKVTYIKIKTKTSETFSGIKAEGLFKGNNTLAEIDLTEMDFSKTTTMSEMFSGCTSLTGITFGIYNNTSKVVNMSYMFKECKELYSITGFEYLNTINIVDYSEMFALCESLSFVNTSNLNTNKAHSVYNMFYNCKTIQRIDTSMMYFDSTTNLTNLFYGCNSLEIIDMSNRDLRHIVKMNGMFAECHELSEINLTGFQTESLKDMKEMFAFCKMLKEIDISNFELNNLYDMSRAFLMCENLHSVNIGVIHSENLTHLNETFMGCEKLEIIDLSGVYINKECDLTNIFAECMNATYVYTSSQQTADMLCYFIDEIPQSHRSPHLTVVVKKIRIRYKLKGEGFTEEEFTNPSEFKSCVNNILMTELYVTNETITEMIDGNTLSYLLNNPYNELEILDLSLAGAKKPTDLSYMCKYGTKLTRLDLSGIDFTGGTNKPVMTGAFANCKNIAIAYARTEEDCEFLNNLGSEDKHESIIFKIKK